MAKYDPQQRRLGDLAESGLLLRLDCVRCGHHRLIRPWALIKGGKSPASPWRWMRFRCECGARDVLVRAGIEHQLARDAPVPLYQREDLVAIVAEAVNASLRTAGWPVERRVVHNTAVTVLRRFMAAGITVSEPQPPPDAA
jgi:hypothetical protein